jgi:hypothetical protein
VVVGGGGHLIAFRTELMSAQDAAVAVEAEKPRDDTRVWFQPNAQYC